MSKQGKPRGGNPNVVNYEEHEDLKIRPKSPEAPETILKVLGIGGAGGNAVNRMIEIGLNGVEFVAMNTDSQVLRNCRARYRLLLGQNLTGGLGAGGKPEIGRKAANEERDGILNALQGAKMVFITAGMGGGTGTGAAPVVAELSKELGILTVGIVTKPFVFEGPARTKNAEEGIQQLKEHVDTLITIPNDKILEASAEKLFINDAFARADDTLRQAVQGVSSIIVDEGVITVDFADVKTVMCDRGDALMGIGLAAGENRALDAVTQAMRNPLTESFTISGATSVLLWIRGGVDFEMREFGTICRTVQEEAGGKTNIIAGYGIDQSLVDHIQVVLIAAGLPVQQQAALRTAQSGARSTAQAAQAAAAPAAPSQFVRQAVVAGQKVQVEGAKERPSEDELEIPSFLRRAQGQ